jgi:hypothetical protein
MRPRSAKASNPRCISARLGKYDVPSMKPGTRASMAGSSLTSEFQSNRSYHRVPRSATAYGFDQLISRWKNGNRRNIPPGWSSADKTA